MKPSIPKGTRDFSPSEMVRRNFIFDTIRQVYQRYGYQQIETPAMENSETLMGKYGEEGDRLIFKILDSGEYVGEDGLEFLKRTLIDNPDIDWNKVHSDALSRMISEKALRYDLTVPFARYVVQHQNEITFPFKRFQIQPVWRADRPQKGRYREFYQCDADVIGSDSLLNEVELIQIIDDVFSQLQIDVTIKLNNRKILLGIVAYCGCVDKLTELATALDKYDKVGREGVLKELIKAGFDSGRVELIIECVFPEDIEDATEEELMEFYKNDIERVQEELRIQNSIFKKDYQMLHCLIVNFKEEILNNSNAFKNELEIGLAGIEEVKSLFREFDSLKLNRAKFEYDVTLARGLNYYTGSIIEVKVNDKRSTFTSSVCGGGRYDDLTGIFGLPNISGVGISFGADRIYDVLEEVGGFPELGSATTKILFVNFGKEEAKFCLKLLKQLHDGGINAELYPDPAKMKKQMSYADDKKIPFVALVGSEEMKSGILTIKDMKTGEQEKISIEKLIQKLK